jgi:hypothetical protein
VDDDDSIEYDDSEEDNEEKMENSSQKKKNKKKLNPKLIEPKSKRSSQRFKDNKEEIKLNNCNDSDSDIDDLYETPVSKYTDPSVLNEGKI